MHSANVSRSNISYANISHDNISFVKLGERIRKIGKSKYCYVSWDTDKWLEEGVRGTVVEYHPESPAVRINGELFEAIPPYAVVQWDIAENAKTCISADDEGITWGRINLNNPTTKEEK